MTRKYGITPERVHQMHLKYDELFWRYPNVVAVSEGYFKGTHGNWMNIIGIVVHVSEKVSPTTVPSEDRMSDIIDGVPVQIRQETLTTIEPMGVANGEHRPLTSGIRIEIGMAAPTKGSACQQGVDMNRTYVLISSMSAEEALKQDQRIRR